MSITLPHEYCRKRAIAARYSLRRSLWPVSRACRSCSIALLAICFACSTFIFSCPPVSGSPRSLHPQPGERGRETGDTSGEIGASRSERAARVSDTWFLVARSVLVEAAGKRFKRRDAEISECRGEQQTRKGFSARRAAACIAERNKAQRSTLPFTYAILYEK